MTPIQAAHAAIGLVTSRCSGELIAKSASQMPKRMTTEGVAAKKNDVDGENNRANSNTE